MHGADNEQWARAFSFRRFEYSRSTVGMNRMRVIVLNDYGFVNGGASQVAISSLNYLAEAGLDVRFISSVGPVDPGINPNLVSIVNFGFHDLMGNPSRIEASLRGLWDSQCARRLQESLRDCNPSNTIVHLHSWVKSLSPSVVRVATSRGFKVVCTLHDYFTVCPNGGLYNFPQRKQCKIRPMSLECIATNCDSRSYTQKLWRVGRHAVQSGLGKIPGAIRYFITVSDYSESIMRPLLPSDSRFFRVSNPIDIDKLPIADVGSQRLFAFIGRLSHEKGADVFAAAAQLANVPALFVGSGEQDKAIRGINPSAELRGWQNRAEVIRAIRSSRAVVFPSLWHETQGLVVQEAAALGVPAIVADSCAARESIINGESGLLFRSGDVSDLSAKLTLLRDQPELAQRLGRTAYARYWSAPSTIDQHTKQLIDCYINIFKN
jgi:glycosyltransferase involved in cell wall biosynthesis